MKAESWAETEGVVEKTSWIVTMPVQNNAWHSFGEFEHYCCGLHQDIESYVSHRIIDLRPKLNWRCYLDQLLLQPRRLGSRELKGLIQSPMARPGQSWEQNTFPLPSQSTSLPTTSASSPPFHFCPSGQSSSALMGVLSTISRWQFSTLLCLGTFLSPNLKKKSFCEVIQFCGRVKQWCLKIYCIWIISRWQLIIYSSVLSR